MTIDTILLAALALLTAKWVFGASVSLFAAIFSREWTADWGRKHVQEGYDEAMKDPIAYLVNKVMKDIPCIALVCWAVWALWGRV